MIFERAIDFVLAAEGRHSNDPNDPGGDTWFGLARRWHPEVTPWPPTREQAIEVYRRKYWDASKCDGLPPAIAFLVFDTAVQSDTSTAIQILQQSLSGLKVDGVCGPATLAAVAKTPTLTLIPEFIARRAVHYAHIPQVVRFGLGWYRRLALLHQAALELAA